MFFGLVLARAARRWAHASFRSAGAEPLPEPEARLDPLAWLDTPAPALSPLADVALPEPALPFEPFLFEAFLFDVDDFLAGLSSSSSVLAFAAAELAHGNGFIAAFVAGLTLGNVTRNMCECLYDFAEAEGQLLTLMVFLVLGATMAPEALAHAGWETLLYAVLSLTLIRMVPVALSMIGLKLRPATVGFLGWFGPRGIASILFGLVVVSRSVLEGGEEIFSVVLVTVLLSVLLHGITAYPGANWYSRHAETFKDDEAEEHRDVAEMRVRIRHEM